MSFELPRRWSTEVGQELTSRLLPAHEAADLLGISRGHLANLRYRGGGPRYVKLGTAVRYREADLAQWIEANING